jgi:hypothetical protein
MLYFDAREWSQEQQTDAEQMKEEFRNAGVVGDYTVHL